jgi:TatD DNase family protein
MHCIQAIGYFSINSIGAQAWTQHMIDTHCHLDVSEFTADQAAVLARSRAAGVQAQIIPAIGHSGFSKIQALCTSEPDCYAAYGLHPVAIAEHRELDLEALPSWLKTPHCVAVGEAGLDFFVADLDPQKQQYFLDAQLRMARDFDLPIILHARRAFDQVTASLRRFGIKRAVVHSFSGSQAQADALFRMGIHIGIGGPITYPRAQRLRRIVSTMPAEFLLLETDAPDQPMHGRQGQRNEPSYLAQVAESIAELRQASPAAITELTTQNARQLFTLAEFA